MTNRSPLQRFLSELRRRHVPQTAAIYMVAAWAAIQFADVVVPNLNGPPWIVVAVIVAAAAGLPVVLVLAWIFEWGPEGIHKTPGAEAADGPTSSSREWVTALAVLLVGIASAVGVAAVIAGADGSGGAGETAATSGSTAGAGAPGAPGGAVGPGGQAPMGPPEPPTIRSPEFGDSLASGGVKSLSNLDSLDVLLDWTRQLGESVAVVVFEPGTWRFGESPHPLAPGDTLEVSGIAQDSVGIVAVEVDGRRVAQSEAGAESLPFAADIVGTGSRGQREVVIIARTRDGREIRRVHFIRQLPAR